MTSAESTQTRWLVCPVAPGAWPAVHIDPEHAIACAPVDLLTAGAAEVYLAPPATLTRIAHLPPDDDGLAVAVLTLSPGVPDVPDTDLREWFEQSVGPRQGAALWADLEERGVVPAGLLQGPAVAAEPAPRETLELIAHPGRQGVTWYCAMFPWKCG
jgi:hypothetical protein